MIIPLNASGGFRLTLLLCAEVTMRAEQCLTAAFKTVLSESHFDWPAKAVIEPPRDARHGDLASNMAMVLAKQAGQAPRELAATMAEALRKAEPALSSVEIAGPGFLNVTFSPDFWREVVMRVERGGKAFGAGNSGAGKKIQVEFVSANPTGPLHIGHGRGAAVGDSLMRVLRFAGYDAQSEYYINDAGRQMRLLGLSVWLRVKEQSGLPVEWPEEYYRGSYIADIAHDMLAEDPRLAKLPDEEGQQRCYEKGMAVIFEGIKEDLAEFRVQHDVWFSEKTLVDSGAVDQAFETLNAAGLTYEQDGALWFKSTMFGDDRDRVLRKSDGSLTYFASDIAYHHNKYKRGFNELVDVWGADHHGYVPRMRAAVQALQQPVESFHVVLIQLVNLIKNGEQVAMSTRAGQFETLADVVREVGVDATRFMFLLRKADSPLDFDLDLVRQRSMDNPVYYVQYAHARICAMLRKSAESGVALPARSTPEMLAALEDADELALLRTLDQFENVTASAAEQLAPQYVSHYLMELAGQLHSYYASHPVLQAADPKQVPARLALLRAVRQVLANGLDLLGVSAPDSM